MKQLPDIFVRIISEHLRAILPHRLVMISHNSDDNPIITIGKNRETETGILVEETDTRILIEETTLYIKKTTEQDPYSGNRKERIYILDLADPQSITKLEELIIKQSV